MQTTPFWLSDPTILIRDLTLLPNQEMTNAQRLNALTRLLLLTALLMYLCGNDQYLTVLVVGIVVILILRSNRPKENFQPHRGGHDPCHTCGLDSSMSYINSKYETTPLTQFDHVNYGLRSYNNSKYKVIPLDTPAPYREIWQNEPRYCNEYSQYPQPYEITPTSESWEMPSNKCHFEDREWIDNTPDGIFPNLAKQSAMPAIQSAFMRDSLDFRNNIMGQYVDFFEKQRQHNCVDFKPGRKTF